MTYTFLGAIIDTMSWVGCFMARRRIVTWHCIMAILLGFASGVSADSTGRQGKDKPIPPFSEVRQAVWRYFQQQRDFQPTDLITSEEVEPLLPQLQRMGLPLADAKQILEKVPAKGEFLVEQLSTPSGRKFMRRIAADPNAYDRLDRLSRMPYGQQTVRDLIKGPGGEKLIDYLTKTRGGAELGKMLSNGRQGERFNTPTGRIYTVEMLLTRLQQSHAAASSKPFPERR